MKKKISFSDGVLTMALILIGGFHEYISCALSIAMSVYLLLRINRVKTLTVRKDILTSAVVAICLGYGLSCLWALDKGMALIGFLKFLPLILYVLCLQQEKEVGNVLDILPALAAVMVIVSVVGMQIPVMKNLFSVAGRLAGFFQYPNTFALFLLVCEMLLLRKAGKNVWDYLILAVLIGGFFYTGSRTAFVVAILANIGFLFCVSKKKVRTILLSLIAVVAIFGALLALNEESVLHRYLRISLTESTLVGRLLYWVDAIPLLLKYPFGMGYMGYYYIQQSVQTGVYAVAYAHNDFIQLLLDIGIVPVSVFFIALGKWFFNKEVAVTDKIIVSAMCIHSFFEFNLQFMGIFFLLLLLMSRVETKKTMQAKPKLMTKLCLVLTVAASVYLGVALLLANVGLKNVSDTLYPYNTQNKLSMLEQTQDLNEADVLAGEILQHNTYYYAPYSIKAKCAYSKGDFGQVIQNGRAALERNPFLTSEYDEYCKMLIIGIDLYQKAGDTKSAEICKAELLEVGKLFKENMKRLGTLGKMIKDQPETQLSDEVQKYIDTLGG